MPCVGTFLLDLIFVLDASGCTSSLRVFKLEEDLNEKDLNVRESGELTFSFGDELYGCLDT